MEILKQFAISIGGIVDGHSLERVEHAADETASSIVGFASAAVAALTAGAFATAIKSTADRFNALGDAAAQMGNITARELDRITYAAGIVGTNAETATDSLHNLTKAMGEAIDGSGGGFDAFQKLGIAVKNADGSVKSITQVMEDLRVKMKDMSTAQQQAIIQALGMDKTAIGLFTADTAEILAQYDERTKALGLNADEIADKSAAFNASLANVSRGFSDVLTAVVVRIMPTLNEAFDRVASWITDNATSILRWITPFTMAINTAVRLVNGAVVGIGALLDVFGELPLIIGLAAAAWKAFDLIMKSSPLGRAAALISAVVTAIGLLIDDFKVAQAGGESFFKFWKSDFFGEFLRAGRGVRDFLTGLADTLLSIGSVIVDILTLDFDGLKKSWTHLGESIMKIVGGIADAFWGTLKGLFGALDETADGALSGLWNAVTEWVLNLPGAVVNAVSGAIDAVFGSIANAVDDALTALSDMVTGWIDSIIQSLSNIGGRMKDAVTGGLKTAASWLGFGDDDDGGGVLSAKGSAIPTPAANAPQTYASSSVVNNINKTYNDTFNVNSAQEASTISASRFARQRAGAS